MTEFDVGVLVGVLVGEGHFGGDGRQPHVVLRMHVQHEALFHWLMTRIPAAKLYGPYSHDGRNYYQWMVRGKVLREVLVPILDKHLTEDLSAHVHARYVEMKRRYHL